MPMLSKMLLCTLGVCHGYTTDFSWPGGGGSHWAVLVAGSRGYGNYRHQADVCHAYQIMLKNGIPEKQIVVLAYDDVANNRENPFPGQMFNKPTPAGTPGVDVYKGCKIDYSGEDVTPDTFVKVLTGDAKGLTGVGSGKVLSSTNKDRVFVNFVDHGAVGIIGFPSAYMHANELVGALTKMHSLDMYKELVFYLEACESGSMFQDLPSNIGIYATTAANAKESSWGTYCSPDDMVNGQKVGSCLGDLYSVNWMEDDDSGNKKETLKAQFEKVKQLTNKSHVIQFGDLTIADEKVRAFEGSAKAEEEVLPTRGFVSNNMGVHMLPSPEAALASAYDLFVHTGSDAAAEELILGVQQRQDAKRKFERIVDHVTSDDLNALPPHDGTVDLDCHYEAHKAYVAKCGGWNEGSIAYSKVFAQLCKSTNGDSSAITAAINNVCM